MFDHALRARPALSLLVAVVACAPDEVSSVTEAEVSSGTLRRNASARLPIVGAAVRAAHLTELAYANELRRQFNEVTPELAMKWQALRPSATTFDFADADRIVSAAEANGQTVRGHTLVWGAFLPAWMNDGLAPQGVRAAMLDHIRTVVARYRGRVLHWDVVNEAVDEEGGLRNNLFMRNLGGSYVAEAFHAAHAVDPEARLSYNDFGIEVAGPKQDAVFALLQDLLSSGVPVHEVGIQLHAHPYDFSMRRITGHDIRAAIRRFGSLGLDVYVTELDAPLNELGVSQARRLEIQQQVYHAVVGACYSQSACRGVTTWGFTDKYTWLTGRSPLLFAADYTRKRAYFGYRSALAGDAPRGVARPWDSACKNSLASAAFCEPVESPTFQGNYRVEQSGQLGRSRRRYRGARALRARTGTANSTRRAYLGRRVFRDLTAGQIWARAYVYLPSTSRGQATLLTVDENRSPKNGVSFGVNASGRALLRIGGSPSYRVANVPFPRNRWACLEMRIVIANDGRAELFIDGRRVSRTSAFDTRFSSPYGTLKFGVVWSPANDAPVDVYFDEVAVSTTRVRCDP